MRHTLVTLGGAALLASTITDTGQAQDTVHIYWDVDNVPTIDSPSDEGALYGQGWALAECQYPILQTHYATVAGNSAQYVDFVNGSATLAQAEEFAALDLLSQHLRIPTMAQQVYNLMDSTTKGLVDAFAQGIADYYTANAATLQSQYPAFSGVMARTTSAEDAIGTAMYFWIVASFGGAAKLVGEGATNEALAPTTHSNEWVIRSDRTTTGRPMLLVDPHVLLQGDEWLNTFLCAMYSPNLSSVGFNQLGVPFNAVGAKIARPAIPGDEGLAWTITAGSLDQGDVFEVDVNQAGEGTGPAGSQYFYDGVWTDFVERTISTTLIDGSTRSDISRWTVHGPVVSETPTKAYAMRQPVNRTTDILAQYFEMSTARDADELYTALDNRAVPGGNYVVASSASDFDDQIRYLLYGMCPIRSESYDWTGIVDGSTPATLWTALHPLADLPQVGGSQQGEFINNNVGIEVTWPGFANQTFPSYMFTGPDWTSYRQERAKILLETGTISQQGMIDAASDEEAGIAVYGIPLLRDAYTLYGSQYPPLLGAVITGLENWDKVSDVDAKEMLIIRYWLWLLDNPAEQATYQKLGRPTFLADWTNADGEIALYRLWQGYLIAQNQGFPDWGDRHFFERSTPSGTVQYPVGGTASSLRAAAGRHVTENGQSTGVFEVKVSNGQTCPIIVDLGDSAVTTTLMYTKALDNSPIIGMTPWSVKMTENWVDKTYRSLPTSAAEAAANADRTETLTYQ